MKNLHDALRDLGWHRRQAAIRAARAADLLEALDASDPGEDGRDLRGTLHRELARRGHDR